MEVALVINTYMKDGNKQYYCRSPEPFPLCRHTLLPFPIHFIFSFSMGRTEKTNPGEGYVGVEDRLQARTTDLVPASKNPLKFVSCTFNRGTDCRKCN